MICSFFGHRKLNVTKQLKETLLKTVENLIKNGFYTFYFGGYGQFNDLCYETVNLLKKNDDRIKRVFIRPYYENINQNIMNEYLKEYDECIYLEPKNNFGKLKIIYRNFAIVDKSDFIVFFVNKDGGAYTTMKYAEKHDKNFLNIAGE